MTARSQAAPGAPPMNTIQAPNVVCYCGSPMGLRKSTFGQFWGCTRWPDCDGVIGAHPDGGPLGIPADRSTREARIKAHAVFDAWWRGLGWKRSRAYAWLKKNGPRPHIAEMDATDCLMLITLIGKQTQEGET